MIYYIILLIEGFGECISDSSVDFVKRKYKKKYSAYKNYTDLEKCLHHTTFRFSVRYTNHSQMFPLPSSILKILADHILILRSQEIRRDIENRTKTINFLMGGMTTRRPISFEIPVILTPGEILSVNNTHHFSTDGTLDLNIHALVKTPPARTVLSKATQTCKHTLQHNCSPFLDIIHYQIS